MCRLAGFTILVGFLSGCTVGPNYKRPEVPTPPSWGWKRAEPRDETIKGDWWVLFHDADLNRLENLATDANRNVQTAVARVDQSRAISRIAAARFYPQVAFDPSINSFHTPLNHTPSELTATSTTVPLDLSYEIDLWGKLRRSFEASRDRAEASVADYCQVLLTLHGDVATTYFLLRQSDVQVVILQQTLDLREMEVKLLEERFQAGLSPELDLDRAKTEAYRSKTTLTELQRERSVLQDALAVLCGQPAPSFQVASGTLRNVIPSIPAGLPSQLLERRPDIAQAERKMAAANAEIGVAKAAFFPALTLAGETGYSSFHAVSLLNWQSALFQVGPGVSMPILNGGRLRAGLKVAKANYQVECANYQQTILVAFREVSDSLVNRDSYAKQNISETNAVTFAGRAADSSLERYKQGLVSYTAVIEAQRTQLQTQLHATQILGLELISTVHLIKALGGGFKESIH